jgi:hypothetical protein
MHDGGEIRLFTGRERTNRPRDFIHRVLSGFGSTGKAADTVGDTENARTFIAKKTVFVVSADSADVGECCGAEQGHEFLGKAILGNGQANGWNFWLRVSRVSVVNSV